MKQSLLKVTRTLALALIAAAGTTTALAQKPEVTGGAALKSEPGKATAVRAVEISAQVVALDKATRAVSLKTPKGDVVDIVASADVKNFDQVKVGDFLFVRYVQALTLELQKVKTGVGAPAMSEGAVKAKPGERPAVAGAREVTAIATVTAVDPKKSTITLKGPRGNVVTLDVQNPDQFKVVKKGDQVEVTYTEALALSVEAATKPEAKKK